MSVHANKALVTLITMLNSLPQDSVVLQFILENLNSSVNVVSTVFNGTVIPNTTYVLDSLATVPRIIVDNCSASGVYSFTHLDTAKQYIGSACSFPIRLSGHLSQLSGDMVPSILHKYIMEHGGLPSIN